MFSDRQHEESRQHEMTRFLTILQDQENVIFAHEFQDTCCGWTCVFQTIFFFTSAADQSFAWVRPLSIH
jgi:hypothetical protein